MAETYDLLLLGGKLVDGEGSPRYEADIGIRAGRIVAIGALDGASSTEKVDCRDLIVAPGFIDSHSHAESDLLNSPVHLPSICQGVTTHVVGHDGFGLAPTNTLSFELMMNLYSGITGHSGKHSPGSIAEFLARFEGTTTCNVATLVPNGCLRALVIGNDERSATASEMKEMMNLCEDAMRDGAIGLSSGLDYVPSAFASTDELIALAEVASAYGGIYVSHVRYELGLIAALDEAFEIGRRAHIPVHVSHLVPGLEDGVSAQELLAHLERAQRRGIDVSFDMYPYTYGCTLLSFVLPIWTLKGDVEEIRARLSNSDVQAELRAQWPVGSRGPRGFVGNEVILGGNLPQSDRDLEGLTLLEAADRRHIHVSDLVCELLLASNFRAMVIGRPGSSCHEDALRAMLHHPRHALASDGIFASGRIHPRATSSFARFLGRMVREEKRSLEQAIYHATLFPAQRHRLADRGRITPGYWADIVAFDETSFSDHASWDDGAALAVGVTHVVVNGELVLLDGMPTGLTPGRALRRSQRNRNAPCSSRSL